MNFFRRIYSFDYMGHKRWWFTISAIIIGAGLISLFVKGGGNPLKGLNYGLEFKEGTRIAVVFTKPAALGDVRAVVTAARELRLVPGRDFEMVGWWTDETYESEYLPLFGKGPVPPAVTWSIATMTQFALARVEERRARPQFPSIQLRVHTRLRLAGEAKTGAGK